MPAVQRASSPISRQHIGHDMRGRVTTTADKHWRSKDPVFLGIRCDSSFVPFLYRSFGKVAFLAL